MRGLGPFSTGDVGVARCLREVSGGALDADVVERFARSNEDGVGLHAIIQELRGRSFWLNGPRSYTLNICCADETILTRDDIIAWAKVPELKGRVHVFGTLGPGRALTWDRWPVAIGGDGTVYTFHLDICALVLRVCGSLRELLCNGVSLDYIAAVDNLNKTGANVMTEADDIWLGSAVTELRDADAILSTMADGGSRIRRKHYIWL